MKEASEFEDQKNRGGSFLKWGGAALLISLGWGGWAVRQYQQKVKAEGQPVSLPRPELEGQITLKGAGLFQRLRNRFAVVVQKTTPAQAREEKSPLNLTKKLIFSHLDYRSAKKAKKEEGTFLNLVQTILDLKSRRDGGRIRELTHQLEASLWPHSDQRHFGDQLFGIPETNKPEAESWLEHWPKVSREGWSEEEAMAVLKRSFPLVLRELATFLYIMERLETVPELQVKHFSQNYQGVSMRLMKTADMTFLWERRASDSGWHFRGWRLELERKVVQERLDSLDLIAKRRESGEHEARLKAALGSSLESSSDPFNSTAQGGNGESVETSTEKLRAALEELWETFDFKEVAKIDLFRVIWFIHEELVTAGKKMSREDLEEYLKARESSNLFFELWELCNWEKSLDALSERLKAAGCSKKLNQALHACNQKSRSAYREIYGTEPPF